MRTVYTIALLAWILIGSFWSKKTFCGTKAKKPAAAEKAAGAAAAATTGDCDRSLMFADEDFKMTTTENFLFPQNSFVFKQDPSAGMQTILTKVADYLNENPGKSVQVEGLYHEKEENTSDFESLGLARAETIKSYLVAEFGINESQIVTGAQPATKRCYYNNNILLKGAITTIGVTQ